MKNTTFVYLLVMSLLCGYCTPKQVNLNQYPSKEISNGTVKMKLFLPDPEKGLYRATRFDWSGIIGSVKYKGHEYFGYWKNTQDPTFHEDLPGPVEGFILPGLGYAEAKPGEGFIRIGVGILEKIEEMTYDWKATYNILDHGKWDIDSGKDWIEFRHTLSSTFGFSYVYTKTVRLKTNGFVIEHQLQNTGEKTIETDQFNHNFFIIDGEKSGPALQVNFPYPITSPDDPKGLVALNDKSISFLQEFKQTSVFLNIKGYSEKVDDHQVTILNNKSGAGVTFKVDQPLYRMAFWACETTLCPENFIWIKVDPGNNIQWIADYTLFEIPLKNVP